MKSAEQTGTTDGGEHLLIYILVDLALILLGLAVYPKENKKYALVISFVMLLLLAGMRGDFTSDYLSYWNFFLKVKYQKTLAQVLNPFVLFEMEKGLVLLLKLLGYVTESPVVVFSVIAAITLFFYYKGFVKLSPMPMLSVLLFVSVGDYYSSYNLVRQIMAASLVFWGFCCWTEGQKKSYWLCLAAAALIHRTALVMVPVLFLLKNRIRIRTFLFYGAACVGIYLALPAIVNAAQELIPAYSNYSYGLGSGTFNAVIPLLGMLAFVGGSLLLNATSFDVDEQQNRILLNACAVAVLLMILGLRIYIVSRFAYYLKPAFCILIPRVIAGYKKEKDRRIVLMGISLIALAFTYITLSGTGYDPYYVIFA